MEFLKKKVGLVTTTGSTSGGTTIIVDTGATYNFKIQLNSTTKNYGFFDTLDDPNATGITATTITSSPYIVTGQSKSRLSELRKRTISGTISDLYFTSSGVNDGDGVNESLSSSGETGFTYVYYLSGITYTDSFVSGDTGTTTIFNFDGVGYDSPNFLNLPIILDESKNNTIDKPELDNDVFIIRQSLPVYENIFRLENVKNVDEIEKYAGGSKFNIVKNS